ncbi:hypothetical protein MCOR27_011179, partial [Pyricularia oryzae]
QASGSPRKTPLNPQVQGWRTVVPSLSIKGQVTTCLHNILIPGPDGGFPGGSLEKPEPGSRGALPLNQIGILLRTIEILVYIVAEQERMGGIRVDPDASMTDGLANMRNGCWIRWERRYQVALAALPLDLTVAYPYTHTREQKHTDAPPKQRLYCYFLLVETRDRASQGRRQADRRIMLVQGKKHKVAGSLEGVSSEDRQNSKSHSDSLSGASSEESYTCTTEDNPSTTPSPRRSGWQPWDHAGLTNFCLVAGWSWTAAGKRVFTYYKLPVCLAAYKRSVFTSSSLGSLAITDEYAHGPKRNKICMHPWLMPQLGLSVSQ